MKRLAAVAAGLVFGAAAMVTPTFATTAGSAIADYGQHAADCFALLFTDPKAHTEQCGGPNFVLPDPPHGSTGFKACGTTGEIDPFGIDGTVSVLVAGPYYCCGITSVDPSQLKPFGAPTLLWGLPATRVDVAVC